ncbi:hypothetical protein BSNK01_15930 [Bacillaceae bacterium]
MNFEERLLEEKIRTALQEKAKHLQPPARLRAKIFAAAFPECGRKPVKKRLAAGIVAACLLVPTAGFAGTYLADQLYGSYAKLKELGGTWEDYERLEGKLEQARDELGVEEFTEFVALLKDLAYYHLKMADWTGDFDKERLSAAERKAYEELLAKLQPYFDKLNQEHPLDEPPTIPLEEARKTAGFPINRPSYLPEGYAWRAERAYVQTEKTEKGEKEKLTIQMEYQQGENWLLILQYAAAAPSARLPQPFAEETAYTLAGYKAFFGANDSRGYNGLKIWVPANGEHHSHEIYVAGKNLAKEELEKIVLSIAP